MASSNNEISKMVSSYYVSAILPYVKKEISKHPQMYTGSLRYWIKENFPKASGTEIRQVFQQLVDDGYLFLLSEIYPPNKANADEVAIMKFILKNNFIEIDHGILHELNKHTRSQLSDLSRIVINEGWHDDERETRISIQRLCKNNIIIIENGYLTVNWKLIRSDLG